MKNLVRLSIFNFFVFILAITIGPGLLKKNNPPSDVSLLVKNSTQPTPTLTPKKLPALSAQLSQHNTASDCWVGYKGKVFNVTSYLNLHPGGAASIAKYCGLDMQVAFDTKNKNPPISHSNQAFQILLGFLLK